MFINYLQEIQNRLVKKNSVKLKITRRIFFPIKFDPEKFFPYGSLPLWKLHPMKIPLA